jgi:hypothetical protein
MQETPPKPEAEYVPNTQGVQESPVHPLFEKQSVIADEPGDDCGLSRGQSVQAARPSFAA